MKALVNLKKGKGNIKLIDAPVPEYTEDSVLIKVETTGICGTDYHIYTGEIDTKIPVIIGHEFAGKVVGIGDRVMGLSIGDRVVSEGRINVCGRCRLCITGNSHMCPKKTAPGAYVNGTMAEYINLPGNLLHKIPDSITNEEASLIEPAAVVVHGILERTKIEPEDFVVIFGPGPIGLLAAQLAKVFGSRFVVVAGTNVDEKTRLPLASKLGADYSINVQKTNIVQEVLDLTNGLGADVVIECSGNEMAINSGIELLRRHGRMGVIGIPGPEKISVNWKMSVTKAQNIIFSYSSSTISWKRVISMIKRQTLDVNSLISHKEQIGNWETVFKAIGKGDVIKAILYP